MSNLDEMRRLKEEILTSFDERLNSIATIVKSNSVTAQSTREMLNRFRDEHHEMSEALKQKLNDLKTNLANDNKKRFADTQEEINQRVKELSTLLAAFKGDGASDFSNSVAELLNNFRSARLNEFDRFMTGLQNQISQNKADVAGNLNTFRDQHRSRSNDMKQLLNNFQTDLAEFKKRLSLQEQERFSRAEKEIEERANYLDTLFKNSSALIENFKNDHAAMSKILRETISFKGFNKERLQSFNELMARIQRNQQKQSQEIAGMLTGFHQAHDEMRSNLSGMFSDLKTNLKQGNADRIRQAQEAMTGRLNSLNAMKSEITTMLNRLQSENQEAIQEWQNIANLIDGKRRGERPSAKKQRTTQAKAPVAEQNAPSMPVENSQNGAEEKILALIKEHGAAGAKLTDIGKAMDLKWQKLIPYAKALIEKDLVRKQDNLYFPN
ncbi:MAG: hypothetical protein ACOY90_10045 [Candidatus Zhuqueibacterota bacterium]